MVVRLHNAFFLKLQRFLEDWLIGTMGRLVFAGVLLIYFWNSAMTKLGDGVAGIINLSPGAYAQILPKEMEAVSFDPSQLGVIEHIIVHLGTYAEFILPALIVFGLFTRLASLGMIAFIAVMTWTDITQHGADAATIGSWFSAESGSVIADQRSLWVFLLVCLTLKGAGPISLDALFGRMRGVR